jgi:flagellar protein FlaG
MEVLHMSTSAISVSSHPASPAVMEPRPVAVDKKDLSKNDAVSASTGKSAVHEPVAIDSEAMSRNLEEAIQKLNEQMKANQRGLTFSKDQVNGNTVVKVINSHTGEMVRQIPDVSLLRAAHSIEALKGMIHDESI